MTTTDEVAGIIGEIDSANSAHDPVEETEISESNTEDTEVNSTESEEKQTQQKETEDVETQETGKSGDGKSTSDATSTETDAHSKTETETSDKTEAQDDAVDWKTTLPPPPPAYQGKEPEIDEGTGQIVNMTPQEYAQYIEDRTRVGMRQEAYYTTVENKAFEVAEQILPEIKTNPTIRNMVENTRIASILSGNQIDTVQAAQQVKEALGITSQRILEAKTEGANNAKVSIETQKNAALGNGSTQKSEGPDKVKELQKRIARGDDHAFAELLGILDK